MQSNKAHSDQEDFLILTSMKSIMVALVLSAFSQTAFCQTIDLSEVHEKKTIDLRTDLSPDTWKMVVLMARDGYPGHAYVAALSYRDDIKGFVTDGAFGLYPAEALNKWILGEVKGSVDIGGGDANPDVAVIVWTNHKKHSDVLELRDKFQKEGTYELLANDCVSLVAEAARKLSLNTPPLTVTPYGYVKGVLDIN